MLTKTQFVCLVDSVGGLGKAFEAGVRPGDCPPGGLRELVEDAYEEWETWSLAASDYYYYIERCEGGL